MQLLAQQAPQTSWLTPAEQLLIHDIVGPEDLPSAVRLNSTSRQLGILLGPAVGGAMMLWLGAPAGLRQGGGLEHPIMLPAGATRVSAAGATTRRGAPRV